jgi:chemotaxis protein CheY-P-specific phosphatase CheC
MEEQSKQVFIGVLAEILEQFAFVFLEEDPSPPDPPDQGPPIWAEIGFSSRERSGRFAMATSFALCSEVAQNVLGVDGETDLPCDSSRSALQEMVNIACGNLLARLYGTEEMFEMSVPACRDISAEEWNNMANREGVVCLSAEEEPVLAQMVLD